MLPFHLPVPQDRPLRLLVVGAHPDDIEIGAGGTLLALSESGIDQKVRYLVLTGTVGRHKEAENASRAFLPNAELAVELHDLPEGRLPTVWNDVKSILEEAARSTAPDLVIAPSPQDLHQDHRTIGEIIPTVFRDALYLAYEIPKWDGDMGRPSTYVPLPTNQARRKVELLHQCFPSQQGRDWWDDEVFLGLARLRGMECRAKYAEAFTCTKAILRLGTAGSGAQF
jgi:LmbE family N-acetylglucosaminyl deacetylase